MKKFIIITIAIIVTAFISILSLVFAFTNTADYTSCIFPNNTKINGIDCSNLSYEQATKKLNSNLNNRHITVTCPLNVRSATFTNLGYHYDVEQHIANAKSHNPLQFAANHYLNLPVQIDIPISITGYDEDFKQRVIEDPMFYMENPIDCHNAYVDLSDSEFPIVEEVYGNKPDMDKFFDDLTDQIQMGSLFFVFDERKYITVPQVRAEDPELLEYQKFCRKYLNQEITYMLGEYSFTISAQELANLMKDDLSGMADEKAVKKYVAELANEYDNVNITREFKSLTGKDVSVPPGTYGWIINQEDETKQLIEDISSHENVKREPKFLATGYGEYSKDMGDTYIDVDISQQMVRYYKDGELIFSSECVTGNRAHGTVTDVGAYYILNKIRNVVLRGDNGDGTEYESFVSYWLGVNWAGEGFHDATWRNKFGGNIWTYDGSHGCINMPPKRMPELYQKAEIDIPVAVHY